jgi:hypothetical protein
MHSIRELEVHTEKETNEAQRKSNLRDKERAI